MTGKHPLEMNEEEFDEYAGRIAAQWVAEDSDYDHRTRMKQPWHIFENVPATVLRVPTAGLSAGPPTPAGAGGDEVRE